MKKRKFIVDLENKMPAVIAGGLPKGRPLFIYNDVCPGGGKTRIHGAIHQFFPHLKIGVIVPRLTLMRQTSETMQAVYGLKLREVCGNADSINPARDRDGWITTYQTIVSQSGLWASEIAKQPYLLGFDEGHHMKVGLNGELDQYAAACEQLMRLAKVVNVMTGTLKTSDNKKLLGPEMPDRGDSYPWLPNGYIQNGNRFSLDTSANPLWCDVFVRYPRIAALEDRAICPVVFHSIDGPVEYKRDGVHIAGKLSEMNGDQEYGARWTAIETGMAIQLLDACVHHWSKNSSGKLLVIAADIKSARKYKRHLAKMLGSNAVEIATSADDDPKGKIEQFRSGTCRVLVSVAMAYEGLDVPEITHVAFLSRIRSHGWIIQAIGRAWRAIPGKDFGHIFVLQDVAMMRVIQEIQADVDQVLTQRDGGGGTGDGFETIEPIGSGASSINSMHLDNALARTLLKEDIRKRLEGAYPENVIDAMTEAGMSAAGKSSLCKERIKTAKDEEDDIKSQINERVKAWCVVNEEEFAVHYGRIKSRNRGKRLSELSWKELQETWEYVQNKYPAS